MLIKCMELKKRNIIVLFAIMMIFSNLTGCSNDQNRSQNGIVDSAGNMVTGAAVVASGTAAERENLNQKAHEAYLAAMKEEEKKLEDFTYGFYDIGEYAFYDVDGNGIDELIASGYLSYMVYTYQDGKLVELWTNKYGGGSIRIYPEAGVVFFPDGHMDSYQDTYIQINGAETKEAAKKTWVVQHISDKESREVCDYEIKGEPANKAEYNAYVNALKKETIVTHDQLAWQRYRKSSYLADFTHDGTEDILEFKLDKIENPDNENDPTVLLKSGATGKTLWGIPVNTVHAGWTGLYYYLEKDKEYLMVFQPTMYQGVANYKYRIFYVDESGKEIVLHSNQFEFDLNHPKETDPDTLRSFAKEVNQYFNKADLIISTLEGEVKTEADIDSEDLIFDVGETLQQMEEALEK